jgi:hypothetical protein
MITQNQALDQGMVMAPDLAVERLTKLMQAITRTTRPIRLNIRGTPAGIEPKAYEQGNAHAYGEAKNIEAAITLIPDEIPPGGDEVVPEHGRYGSLNYAMYPAF